MGQDLFSLLEIFDLELLLEQFIFFLFQVRSSIILGPVKIYDLFIIVFSLLLQIACDLLNRLCLLQKLSDLCSDLVLVVLLTLNHVLLLGDLLCMGINDLFLLFCEFCDLMELVLLLRCQLLLVFHL